MRAEFQGRDERPPAIILFPENDLERILFRQIYMSSWKTKRRYTHMGAVSTSDEKGSYTSSITFSLEDWPHVSEKKPKKKPKAKKERKNG